MRVRVTLKKGMKWIVLLLLVTLLFVSCAPTAVQRVDDPSHPLVVDAPLDRIPSEYRSVLAEAEKMLQEERFHEGHRLYEAILAKDPPAIVSSWSQFRIAQILVALDRTPEALPFFKSVTENFLGESFEEEALAALVRAYRGLGDYESLDIMVEDLRTRDVPASYRNALLRAAAEDSWHDGSWSEALFWYVKLMAGTTDTVEEARIQGRVDELINQHLDKEALETLALQYGHDYPSGYILYRLAYLYLEEGLFLKAEDHLNEILEFHEDYPRIDEVHSLYHSLVERRKAETLTVGCVLPLTGRFAPYGNKVLEAITLASGVFDPSKRHSIRLAVRDSKSDPDEARRAVEDLVQNEEVIAILGPLESRSALEAARQAQRLRVPIITLTQREAVTEAGDYVFRHFLTPHLQVEALVEYSTNRLGVRRFAILYPDDAYGREMMFRFWHAVASAGGSIGGIEAYDPEQADFSDPVRSLVGLDGARGGSAVPRIDFDVLFVPDSALRARLIAPFLEFHDVIGVRLLGMSEWNVPDLLEGESEYLEGAVFVDVFFRDSYSLEVMDFLDRFYSAFGREPDSIEALAYDAAAIIVEGLENRGARSRRELRDWLLELEGYQGVTGEISFEGNGDARKKLSVLTVQNGRIVELQ